MQMTQATEQILEGLQALMTRQGAWQDEFPGTPFVNSETEFGITMGLLNGGLYAMHHLIDSLDRSDFFDGEREPRTDLDAMVYEFGLGKTRIYDGVVASRTEGGMKLTITTDRSPDEILAAIGAGVEAAQARLDQRTQEAAQYAQMVRAEFAKEEVSPVFDEETDSTFVKNYLKAKTDGYFTGEPNAEVYGALPAHDYLAGIFSEYGITDNRPRFEVSFTHTEENYGPFNDFHNSALREVFTAPLAVNVNQTQDTSDGTIEFEVRGNPSRLVRDIVKNDPSLAATVAQDMGLTIPASAAKDNVSLASSNDGVRQPQGGGGAPNGFEGGPA
ncbi:MAG: hypothetical protein H6864_07375 [Micavibrio sp.]|nr:hypothetical protein [Micavibrio sp.]